MTEIMNWTVVAVVLLALGTMGGALLSAVCLGAVQRALNDVDPRGRFLVLSGLAFLPLLVGFAVVVVAFYPSFLDLAGMASDHCGHHQGQAFHLCFLHVAPPSPSWIRSAVAAGFIVWVGLNWGREIQLTIQAHRWSERLMKFARYDRETSSFVVDTTHPIALTTGLFRRRIVLSSGLTGVLTKEQLSAVLEHERTHLERFDGLTTLVLRMVVCLHLPVVRRRLLHAIELTAEQICDEAAARKVGDPLVVAEAILAVERASGASAAPRGVLCFGARCVEKRVFGLLRTKWTRLNWTPLALVIGLLGSLAVMNLHELHHLLEHVSAGLF